eukprot:COSAG06_NODE_3472_length_5295_cov_3.101039_4_plen_311_part_01
MASTCRCVGPWRVGPVGQIHRGAGHVGCCVGADPPALQGLAAVARHATAQAAAENRRIAPTLVGRRASVPATRGPVCQLFLRLAQPELASIHPTRSQRSPPLGIGHGQTPPGRLLWPADGTPARRTRRRNPSTDTLGPSQTCTQSTASTAASAFLLRPGGARKAAAHRRERNAAPAGGLVVVAVRPRGASAPARAPVLLGLYTASEGLCLGSELCVLGRCGYLALSHGRLAKLSHPQGRQPHHPESEWNDGSTKHGCILTPPSSKIRSIRPFLVFRAHGRYSAFRLCARHVRSADTSRRENASSARVCGQR